MSLNSTLTCLDVASIPLKDQCAFVSDHCADYRLGMVDHFQMYYCLSSSPSVRNLVFFPISLTILVLLFISLGMVAGKYLCPNLSAVSSFLKIPDNISGMTLLALGNDSPDLMSTYNSFRTNNASLAVGELIGAAFFVTCFVIGSVSITRPFSLLPQQRPREDGQEDNDDDDIAVYSRQNAKAVFFRDTLFFLFTLLLLLCFLATGILRRPMLWILVTLHVIYTSVIISWQVAADQRRQRIETEIRIQNLYDDSVPLHFDSEGLEFEDEYTFNPAIINNIEFGSLLDALTKNQKIQFRLSDARSYHDNPSQYEIRMSNEDEVSPTPSVQEPEQPQGGVLKAVFSTITKPIDTVLKYTVPKMTTDQYSTEYKFTFTQLVSLLSAICVWAFVFIHSFVESASVLLYVSLTLSSIILALYTYQNMILSGHQSDFLKLVISTLGFITAVSWIGVISEELINDLKFISVLTQLSEAILGLTVFAVGNSVGDLISDIVIAKLGYPLMALAACIGGPLMNMLLGIGASGLFAGGRVEISMSACLYATCFFVMINLVFMMLYLPRNNWRFDRVSGSAMVGLWCVGTVINILIEVL